MSLWMYIGIILSLRYITEVIIKHIQIYWYCYKAYIVYIQSDTYNILTQSYYRLKTIHFCDIIAVMIRAAYNEGQLSRGRKFFGVRGGGTFLAINKRLPRLTNPG